MKSLNCPVLALTFDRVQFFQSANISKNVAHLMLLPPSESMVDSSVVDISISDSMRYLPDKVCSLSPKSSLNVSNEQHLEDSFGHSQSIPLHDFLALSNEAMAKTLNLPTLYSNLGVFSHSGATPSTPFQWVSFPIILVQVNSNLASIVSHSGHSFFLFHLFSPLRCLCGVIWFNSGELNQIL